MTDQPASTPASPPASAAPMPSGLCMQLSLRDIDKGLLWQKLNEAIAGTYRSLFQYVEKTGDKKGAKAKVALIIELSPDPDMADHVHITYGIKRSIPEPKAKTYVKSKGDILLADATKEAISARTIDREDPITLFTFMGEEAGLVDPVTLTMLEPGTATAGEIKPA